MLTARCQCGEVFHADESHAGRRLRCRCGRMVEIRAPAARSETPPDLGRIPWPKRPRQRKAEAPPKPRTAPRPKAPESRFRRKAAAWATLLSWAYLACAILACVVLWGWGDRWVPATVFLFAGRWLLLLPLLILVPLAAARPRLFLPLAAAAAVIVVPVMGFRLGVQLPAGDDAVRGRLRVVTFNAEGGGPASMRLPDLLEDWRPDVVAFQECIGPLINAIRALRGWHHNVQEFGGLCLVSRYPIDTVAVMDRSTLERIAETSSIGGSGNVIRYTIRTPYGPVDVTNLHLETPRKGFERLAGFDWAAMRANTELREIEAHLARSWAEQGTVPRLVVGDFNTPVESRIFQRHWSGYADAWEAAGRGFGWTRDNGWIDVRIDHVLAGPGWRVERVSVSPDNVGSDHSPVIADLRLLGGS